MILFWMILPSYLSFLPILPSYSILFFLLIQSKSRDLLLGIASNKHIKNLELDLSSNEFKTTGANMIGSCIATIRNITRLDLSDNGFDSDLKSLLGWVSQNRYIKHIALGRNFQNVKPKNLEDVLNSVVELIQEDNSPLESISLADSKLKTETTVFINALGSNSTLRSIDISGNNMGDVGARMLSKALQINTKLHTVYWDKNNTTAQGFDDVAAGLQRNYTVKKMPTPIIDAAKCQSERAQVALEKIESLLQRNHCPRKFASDQAYRLQQGFLISATQQMVDRLVVQVQDTVNALERNPQDDMKEDIERAVNCIKDADTSKQLLPRLQEIAFESEKEGGTIQKKLNEISQNLSDVLHDQLQENLGEMVTCAEKQCPTVLSDKNLKSEIETTCDEKSTLPANFSRGLIVEQVGTDVMNKISELNLSVAAHMSDRVIDGVIESLSSSHKSLINHLNIIKSGRVSKRSMKDVVKAETSEKAPESIILRTKDSTPEVSPKLSNKRKSLASRKLRPQSVIARSDVELALTIVPIDISPESDSNSVAKEPLDMSKTTFYTNLEDPLVEEQMDKDVEKVQPEKVRMTEPINVDEPESPPKAMTSKSENDLAKELDKLSNPRISLPPMGQPVQNLNHLVKSRPKRAKTHAAKRAITHKSTESLDGTIEEDDSVSDFHQMELSSSRENSIERLDSKESSAEKEDASPSKDEPKKKGVAGLGAALAKDMKSFFSRKSPSPKSPDVSKKEIPTKKETPEPPSQQNKPKETPTTPVKTSITPVKTDAMPEPKIALIPPSPSKIDEEAEKSSPEAEEKKDAEEHVEEEKDEVPEDPQPPPRRSVVPKIGLPGMGMGGGMFAEMQKKRATINFKKVENLEKDKEKDTKESSPQQPVIGLAKLRKSPQAIQRPESATKSSSDTTDKSASLSDKSASLSLQPTPAASSPETSKTSSEKPSIPKPNPPPGAMKLPELRPNPGKPVPAQRTSRVPPPITAPKPKPPTLAPKPRNLKPGVSSSPGRTSPVPAERTSKLARMSAAESQENADKDKEIPKPEEDTPAPELPSTRPPSVKAKSEEKQVEINDNKPEIQPDLDSGILSKSEEDLITDKEGDKSQDIKNELELLSDEGVTDDDVIKSKAASLPRTTKPTDKDVSPRSISMYGGSPKQRQAQSLFGAIAKEINITKTGSDENISKNDDKIPDQNVDINTPPVKEEVAPSEPKSRNSSEKESLENSKSNSASEKEDVNMNESGQNPDIIVYL
ncbi:unnamed protein product [Owenia fusiformis]|uniref:Uncharacterized protein n=1 Tax=Owenia fusiformis TaxID=6347 RepID=A0A8J1UTH0_OWEFU|nr:unnamed protein product [Owenia fusiformis]